MAIPPSGPLGFSAINAELGLAPNAANSSINSPVYRTLANVPSGQISVSDFYGKSPSTPLVVEYAILAGGGGAGSCAGGGGGSGGLLTNICAPYENSVIHPLSAELPYISGCSFCVVVGAGGAGKSPSVNASVGTPSRVNNADFTICLGGSGAGGSEGGGAGGNACDLTPSRRLGTIGGSGGGGAGGGTSGGGNTCANPVLNNSYLQLGKCGSSGGSGILDGGGGGGGLCFPGGAPYTPVPNYYGKAGDGITWRGLCSFGGGGGGASNSPACTNWCGGLGGGGNAATNPVINGSSGQTNTGGGGGAGRCTGNGGGGGSGIVIIGYNGPQVATGGTVTTLVPGYTYHVFTSSGTFTWD